jgi:hypothetical protein
MGNRKIQAKRKVEELRSIEAKIDGLECKPKKKPDVLSSQNIKWSSIMPICFLLNGFCCLAQNGYHRIVVNCLLASERGIISPWFKNFPQTEDNLLITGKT